MQAIVGEDPLYLELEKLPQLGSKVYRGLPGVGHPDEERIDSMYSRRHWTELLGDDFIKEVSDNYQVDDIVLMKLDAICLLMPGFLLGYLRDVDFVHSLVIEELPVLIDSYAPEVQECLVSSFSFLQLCELLHLVLRVYENTDDGDALIEMMKETLLRAFDLRDSLRENM